MLLLGFDPNPELAKAAILLVPAMGLLIAIRAAPPSYFERVGLLLSLLWAFPSLVLLNVAAQKHGWWHYAPSDPHFFGAPLELLFGWTILWGGLLPYLSRFLSPWIVCLTALGLDLLAMPYLGSVFTLGPQWLLGEAMLLLGVLAPSIAIYTLTRLRLRVGIRAIMQSFIWGGWIMFLIPEIALTDTGKSIFDLLNLSLVQSAFFYGTIPLAVGIGYAALHEFAVVGKGTPIPFDPPQRLVTSGPYAYVANPLQISTALMFIILAITLQSWRLLLPLALLVIYTELFVRWHHSIDIAQRLPQWATYRAAVRNWWPRWTPYQPGGTVYTQRGCAICESTRRWLEALPSRNITFADALDHPTGGLRRITIVQADHQDQGISAILRVFETINLSTALPCWMLRLPPIAWFVQLVIDATATRATPIPPKD